MKLQFSHRGRQFFFVTLTLEGRVKALSRIFEGGKAPELTLFGEIALSVLLALNKVYPCVTVSNRVIMPDHIHFLMIVNYDLMPKFNPLWVSYIVMDAIEEAWARTDGGSAPAPPLAVANNCIKPALARSTVTHNGAAFDAAELLYDMVVKTRNKVAAMKSMMRSKEIAENDAAAIMSKLSADYDRDRPMVSGTKFGGGKMAMGNGVARGLGGSAPVRSILRFERRVYIELSFDSRQLKTIRRYIKLNPARALWKRLHPDRFIRFAGIKHFTLDANRTWDAMGNLTLLGSPFLFHVRLTLKKTLAEHESAICEIVEKAKRGMIPVSGFISPGEVEALRRLKAEPCARFIKLLPCAMPPRYDPSAEDSRELAADRLLILSGFRNTAHISAPAMRRDRAQARLFRSNCLAMNDLAASICANSQM